MSALYILIPVVLLCTGVTVYTVSSFRKSVEAAINSVETAVHDRANHLVLDAAAFEKKLGYDLGAIKSAFTVAATHVTAETKKIETSVIDHTKAAVHGAYAAATGVRNAICSVCGKLSHTWHVVDGFAECEDCKIRKAIN